MTNHRLDTDQAVFFYENEFYPLSSFSAFKVNLWGHQFPTAEHAYHWRKFMHLEFDAPTAQMDILAASSAHDALRLARAFERAGLLSDKWEAERVGIMRQIIRAKTNQHEYVKRKLLETGDRIIVEDSWRDDFWGWGENRDGANTLGHLWMALREELQAMALRAELRAKK